MAVVIVTRSPQTVNFDYVLLITSHYTNNIPRTDNYNHQLIY